MNSAPKDNVPRAMAIYSAEPPQAQLMARRSIRAVAPRSSQWCASNRCTQTDLMLDCARFPSISSSNGGHLAHTWAWEAFSKDVERHAMHRQVNAARLADEMRDQLQPTREHSDSSGESKIEGSSVRDAQETAKCGSGTIRVDPGTHAQIKFRYGGTLSSDSMV